MPYGSHLQFRYESGLVAEGIRVRLAANQMANLQVCVAYLDRSNSSTPPEIVPCRKAALIESHLSGDMFILKLQLEEFWISKDIPAFNKQSRGLASNLPYWQDGNVVGSFCQVMASMPASLSTTTETADWQQLTKVLKAYKHFAAEPFFYRVKSLNTIKDGKEVLISDNAYSLQPNTSYQLTIIQYGPGSDLDSASRGETYWLLANNDDEQISFTATNEIAVDSPYDEKVIRFRTSNPTHKTDSAIALLRQTVTGVPDSSKAILDFDLSLRIETNYSLLLMKGVAVGTLIAAQGAAAIYLNQSIEDKAVGYVIVGLAGLAAGLIASFGLRKV